MKGETYKGEVKSKKWEVRKKLKLFVETFRWSVF